MVTLPAIPQQILGVTTVMWLLLPGLCSGNLNLYLTKEEVKGLLGLSSELYYVRAGVPNTYALSYTVKVPSNISTLHFTWNSEAKRPMPYEAAVEFDNSEAMALPQLNISAKGIVPTQPTTFRLSLPCSGASSAEVIVSLHLNVSMKYNTTAVTIRRKKICLKQEPSYSSSSSRGAGTNDAKDNGSGVGGERNDSVYLGPQLAPSSLGAVYIAMGCAATATVLVITLTALLYLRIRRARDSSGTSNSRFYSCSSHFSSGRPQPSLRSASYATIASCKHLNTHTKTVLLDNRSPLGYNFSISCMGPGNKSSDELGINGNDNHSTAVESSKDPLKTDGSSVGLLGAARSSCVSERSKGSAATDSLYCGGIANHRGNTTSSSIAGIRNGTVSTASSQPGDLTTDPFLSACLKPYSSSTLIPPPLPPLLNSCSTPASSSAAPPGNGNSSLHYASSPLNRPRGGGACSPQSQVYSQPYYSPAHSWHPNSGLGRPSTASNASWGNTLRSQQQVTWRDRRKKSTKEIVKTLEVDRWRVVLGDVTHGGTFGRVHEGICRDHKTGVSQPVIVKTVSGAASSSQAEMVLLEGLMLAGLEHDNLLPVMGVCTASPHAPLLLYPYHSGSHNLKQYLIKSSTGSGGVSKLLTHDAVSLAIGICKGLIHLHQNGVLHKDVATRNCTVDSEMCVRLGDTALARDLFPTDYHCLGDNENRPVKWLPLETLQHNTYSTAADVWMFGVVVWELVTLAQSPYVEVDPYEMTAYLRDGYRLAQPRSCPDDLYGVMAMCWAPQPEDRPLLLGLLAGLESFMAKLTAFV